MSHSRLASSVLPLKQVARTAKWMETAHSSDAPARLVVWVVAVKPVPCGNKLRQNSGGVDMTTTFRRCSSGSSGSYRSSGRRCVPRPWVRPGLSRLSKPRSRVGSVIRSPSGQILLAAPFEQLFRLTSGCLSLLTVSLSLECSLSRTLLARQVGPSGPATGGFVVHGAGSALPMVGSPPCVREFGVWSFRSRWWHSPRWR